MRGALLVWGRRGIWRRRRRKRRWRFWRDCAGRRVHTEGAEKEHPSASLRAGRGHGELAGRDSVVKAGAELRHSKGGNIDRFSRLAALKPTRGIAARPAEL